MAAKLAERMMLCRGCHHASFSVMHAIHSPASVMTDTPRALRIAYKVPDAAEQLGVSKSTMWRLVRSGEVKSFLIGNCRRISHDTLVELVRQKDEDSATAQAA